MHIATFRSGDGVEHSVEIGCPAYALMMRDGSFTRLDAPLEDEETAHQKNGEALQVLGSEKKDPQRGLPDDFPCLKVLHGANITNFDHLRAFIAEKGEAGLIGLKGIGAKSAAKMVLLAAETTAPEESA